MKKFIYKEQFKESAYVYIISDNNEYIKVGISKNPEKRLKQLQTGHPTKLEILYTEEFYCTRKHLLKIETLIHKKIKTLALNAKGEWFKISTNDLAKIKEVIVLYRIYYEDNEIGLEYGLSMPLI